MGPRNTPDETQLDEVECTMKERPVMEMVDSLHELTELRVFGYGSILWNTGFGYETAEVGYIEGYARRFWQGNTTHRGTPNSPGRVATLVKESDSQVWGMVYHVVGTTMIQKCLEHLGVRECILGGYSCQLLPYTSKFSSTPFDDDVPQHTDDDVTQHTVTQHTDDDDTQHEDDRVTQHLALAFIAIPENEQYLGPAESDEIADQVVASHGSSGSNSEYIVRLAEFVRAHIPEDDDEHLFELDQKVRERLHAMNLDKMSLEKLTNGSALQRTESSSNDARKRSLKSSEVELIKSLVTSTLLIPSLETLKS